MAIWINVGILTYATISDTKSRDRTGCWGEYLDI